MRIYFLLSLLIFVVLTQQPLKLQIQDQITIQVNTYYTLTVSGGYGASTFRVEWLPLGVIFQGNQILATENAFTGTSVIRIWVTDQSGSTDMKIVVLNIIQNEQVQKRSSSRSSQSVQEEIKSQKVEQKQVQNLGTSQTQKNSSIKIQLIPQNQNYNSEENQIKVPEKKQTQTQQQTNTPLTAEEANRKKALEIASKYTTITTTKTPNYQNNQYPQVKFPSGQNPNTVNVNQPSFNDVPSTTLTRQEITERDVALRAASERHQNAIKAITNLLVIIDQAKANRAAAKNYIEQYVEEYNSALKTQRSAQNKIIQVETKVVQIQSALEGANSEVIELRQRIKDLINQRSKLEEQKFKLLGNIAIKQKTNAQLLQVLEKTNSEITATVKELGLKREENSRYESVIEGAKQELTDVRVQYNNLRQKRFAAEQYVKNKAKSVQVLRKQLLKAEQDLASSQINLVNIKEEQNKLPYLITQIQRKVSSYTVKFERVQKQIEGLVSQINLLKTQSLVDLLRQIQQLQDQIIKDRSRITSVDSKIASSLQPLKNLQVRIFNTQNDIQFLQTQIVNCQEQLRQAYIQGNQANTLVSYAKQNLQASNLRYQSQDKIISQATLNLERARAQEALARLALQELIAVYSDALPYAIVPNGNSASQGGTPSGNNPSGSPLGPINNSGNGAQGQFVVRNWTTYLSQAFGAGVHPSFPGSVTKLYPFSFYSQVSGNVVRNNYYGFETCGGFGRIRVGNGRITQVQDDGFSCRLNNGYSVKVNLRTCTKMESNRQNYKLRVGDEVIVKGIEERSSMWNGNQVVCLS